MQVLNRSFFVYRQMKRFFLFTISCTLAIFASIGLLAGCNKEQPVMPPVEPTPNTPSPASGTGTYSYLALGDSYTIGQGVTEGERFPHLTVALLQQQGVSMKTPEYIAQTGWSTIALQNAMIGREPLGSFDVVSLLIGVNDQYQGLDTAGYRVRFEQLLAKAILLAGNRPARVFVLSIPDYSATPFVEGMQKDAVSKTIDSFNRINKEITMAHQVVYIDITPSTREAAIDQSLLAGDRLHYSAKEHAKWADRLAAEMKKVLQ